MGHRAPGARCSRRPTGSCATRLRRGGFATAFLAVVDGRRSATATPATRRRSCCATDGEREPLPGSGLPLGVEDDGAPRGARGRDGPRRRAVRRHRRAARGAPRAALLRRRAAARAAARARRATRARSSSPSCVFAPAQEWAPVLHDDVVVLALRRAPEVELRDEPARGAGRAGAVRRVQALVRERLGAGFAPTEAIFASERGRSRSRAPPSSCSTSAGAPVGVRRAALARAGAGGDQAHVRDRPRRAGTATARRLLAELEAIARADGRDACPAAHHRGAGRGARALRVGRLRRRLDVPRGRPADYWLEKAL